jgi:two-component system catabolic regulation response regulator CreB
MRGVRILVVEDDRGVAVSLADGLSDAGFDVSHAPTGQAALDAEAAEDVDVVLLDLGLPDMDGRDVCRQLRSRSSNVPIIMLTARSDEFDRVLGLELGADDYVAKPFSPRELVARVRAVLRRSRAAPPATGFEHDADGHRIFFRGRLLDLTRYEYGLLAALLQRPGAILTRAQLMDRVWSDSDSSDRTVDTHIKTLRAKLREIDPDADPIRTQRGLGYALHAD